MSAQLLSKETPSTGSNGIRILIVEDNPADAYLTKLALKRQGLSFSAIVVDDGEPAIAYLKAEAPYEGASLPDLVVLDLNLKCMDGLDVLRWIRAEPKLDLIPVVVLSSSPADAQREAAAQANRYLEKPSSLDAYMALGKALQDVLPHPS